MKNRIVSFAIAAVACAGAPLAAQRPDPSATSYVIETNANGAFNLSSNGRSAPLYVSSKDFPGVVRVVNDLRADIERVTGIAPRVVLDSTPTGQAVIVGTIGNSPLIDRLVREKKLNVAGIAGKWETFVVQPIDKPLPGVDRALVIAGSDKRGTVFGVYDLSAEIGVSPWYYWADVPTERRPALFVTAGAHSRGEPAVKYRGIFINDEAPAFSGWTREKFGGVNHVVYEKMFELILRMKGNYLWPAMWNNAFADDDSLNAKLADEYGIVMGTSHHEPLTRAQKEWTRYGKGPWDYEKNDSTLRNFWRFGIERMWNNGSPRENLVTIGMRGDGDRPMTQGTAIGLLERIVADQRKIIADVTHLDPAKTPQVWALYKEVQDYYDQGMTVPQDVTLLFADDNWGNVRRLPKPSDRNRPGGFGVYYHFDYVGGPRNYKWLNTNPIARVWEQMHLTYEWGAKTLWVVNVGDLKPVEFPINFFLDYAWNPNSIPAAKLPEYTRKWAEMQFPKAQASEIADLTTTYLKYAGRRKPELVDTATYSLTNYREAERVVAEYDALLARAERVGKALPQQYQDAYYQLVLHPIQAMANLHDMYVTAAKNRAYALEGRAATNDLAARVRELFDKDAEISRFYNTQLAGGKWAHMMDQTHIGYTYWQEPPRNTMPRVDVISLAATPEMGVSIVEQNRVPFNFGGRGGRGGGGFPPGLGFGGRGAAPALPAFDNYQRQTFHVDVFNRGPGSFDFTAQAAEPFVTISPARGRVEKQQRVAISIDWSAAPAGERQVPITFTGPNNARTVINATISNPAFPKRDSVVGHVQGNGYVSIEAEHYARAVNSANGSITWLTIPDLGKTLSGVQALPVTHASQAPGGNSPHLEYPVFLFDSGAVKVNVMVSPTLNFTGQKEGLRYAVSFDDQAPKIVNIHADTSNRFWEKIVADNIATSVSEHQVDKPGAHVLKFWVVDPGVVLQKIVLNVRDIAPSYLGPPESFYRPASAAALTGSARKPQTGGRIK